VDVSHARDPRLRQKRKGTIEKRETRRMMAEGGFVFHKRGFCRRGEKKEASKKEREILLGAS